MNHELDLPSHTQKRTLCVCVCVMDVLVLSFPLVGSVSSLNQLPLCVSQLRVFPGLLCHNLCCIMPLLLL